MRRRRTGAPSHPWSGGPAERTKDSWRGGRAVQCTGLENRRAKALVGSNPTPSVPITEIHPRTHSPVLSSRRTRGDLRRRARRGFEPSGRTAGPPSGPHGPSATRRRMAPPIPPPPFKLPRTSQDPFAGPILPSNPRRRCCDPSSRASTIVRKSNDLGRSACANARKYLRATPGLLSLRHHGRDGSRSFEDRTIPEAANRDRDGGSRLPHPLAALTWRSRPHRRG
jgi:hypothetical protein